MDIDVNTSKNPEFRAPTDLSFEPSHSKLKSKTSLRLRYESEARVILRQIGGLEGVRKCLGLSQRKMAQLLLVDPSAWSRWVRDESKTPPHVIRALQWYLQLEQKDPSWAQWRELIHKREADPSLDRWRKSIEAKINQIPPKTVQIDTSISDTRIKERLDDLHNENSRLASELDKRMIMGVGWKLILILNSAVLVYWFFKTVF